MALRSLAAWALDTGQRVQPRLLHVGLSLPGVAKRAPKISIPSSGPHVKCTKLEGEVTKMRALPFRLESLSEREYEVWEPNIGEPQDDF